MANCPNFSDHELIIQTKENNVRQNRVHILWDVMQISRMLKLQVWILAMMFLSITLYRISLTTQVINIPGTYQKRNTPSALLAFYEENPPGFILTYMRKVDSPQKGCLQCPPPPPPPTNQPKRISNSYPSSKNTPFQWIVDDKNTPFSTIIIDFEA